MSDQDEIFRVTESVVPQLLAQPGVTTGTRHVALA